MTRQTLWLSPYARLTAEFMRKKLKIVSISAEVAPFSKTGGLAEVAKSLPKALKKLGHEIIIITPFYAHIIDAKQHNLKLIFQLMWITYPLL